jgi:chromosome transmission fidelity protein 18
LPRTHADKHLYRDLDALCQFETAAASLLTTPAPTRYAVRQALGQELRRVVAVREAAARQARFRAGARAGEDLDAILAAASAQPAAARAPKKTAPSNRVVVKRDFFGRVIAERPRLPEEAPARNGNTSGNVVWVTYNEGLNNAVKKPISFDEFMRGF